MSKLGRRKAFKCISGELSISGLKWKSHSSLMLHYKLF